MPQASHGRISSQQVGLISSLAVDDVDLFITSASWDSRVVHNLNIQWSGIGGVVVVRFPQKGVSGRAHSHERMFPTWARSRQTDLLWLDLDTGLEGGWLALREIVIAQFTKIGRPLKVLVDLNAVPRYLSLSLLGFGARSGVVAEHFFVYTSAINYSTVIETPSAIGLKAPVFTQGDWRPISIPTLSQGAPASARSHLVVSAGFEGPSTLRLVNALEPDRVSLIIGGGVSSDHDEFAHIANGVLSKQYLLGPGETVMASLLDLSSATDEIRRMSIPEQERPDGTPPEFPSFLLAGPNSLSLAMAVVALDAHVAHLYYPLAEANVEQDVVEKGQSGLYGIRS